MDEKEYLSPQPPPLTWRQAQFRRALKLLGVGRYASEVEIKAAYRRRLLETHPDKKGGSEEEFHAVKTAYETLARTFEETRGGDENWDDDENVLGRSGDADARRSTAKGADGSRKRDDDGETKRARRARIFAAASAGQKKSGGVGTRRRGHVAATATNASSGNRIDTSASHSDDRRTSSRAVAPSEDLQRLGFEALTQKDYKRALQYFHAAAAFTSVDRGNAYARLCHGRARANIGLERWTDAMVDAKRAATLRPLWVPGLVLYARTLIANEMWAVAVDTCRAVLDLCISQSKPARGAGMRAFFSSRVVTHTSEADGKEEDEKVDDDNDDDAYDYASLEIEASTMLQHAEEAIVSSSCVGIMRGHTAAIRALRFEPARRPRSAEHRTGDECSDTTRGEYALHSSHRIATASDDGTARIWDAATCECLHILRGHDGPVRDIAWCPESPDFGIDITDDDSEASDHHGPVVATCGADGTARLWAIGRRHGSESSGSRTAARCLCVLEGHMSDVTALRFDAYGGVLATCSTDRTARLWDTETGLALHVLGPSHRAAVTCVAFAPNGRTVTTGSSDQDARVWDLFGDTGEPGCCLHTLRWESGAVTAVEYTRDGLFILLATHSPVPNRSYGRVLVWSAVTGRICKWYDGHTGAIRSMVWAPVHMDARRRRRGHKEEEDEDEDARMSYGLVTGSRDGTVRVWSIRGEPAGEGSFDLTIDIGNGAVVSHSHTESYLYDGSVFCASYNPDGSCIAAGSQDGYVRVFSPSSGELISELGGHGRHGSHGADAGGGSGAVLALDWLPSSISSISAPSHGGGGDSVGDESPHWMFASAYDNGDARCWRVPAAHLHM